MKTACLIGEIRMNSLRFGSVAALMLSTAIGLQLTFPQ